MIVKLGADTGPLTKGLAEGRTAIEQFAQTTPGAGATGAAAATSTPGADVGNDLQAALFSGMAPLASIGSKITAQINAVGGTITTLARRIDASMKFPVMDAMLGRLQAKIENPFLKGSIGAVRAVNKVRDALGHMGDVAGKGLDRVSKLNFNSPVAGSGLLARNFRTIAPAAAAATTAVRGLGFQIAAALGVVGVVFKGAQMMKDFFVGGIKGASDLNETLSKTREVFGEGAMGPIVAQADELGKEFGLVKGPILDASASIGLVAKAGGQSNAEAADLAVNLTRLAADASSFYNVPLETALEKIRSGLVGEAEPMRAFGVLLSETAVKAEAQALGLARGKGVLDERAKVTARASLITKGLATAEGDLARTSESASNQFRKAGGGLQNFSTQVGAVLMPAVQVGVGAFNELLASLIETFEANRPMVESWGAALAGVMETVGFTVRNFGDIFEVVKLGLFEKIINIVEYFGTIPANLAIIGEYVAVNWTNLIIDAVNAVASVFMNLGKNIASIWDGIQSFLRGEGFHFDWTPLLAGFEATAAELPTLIEPALTSLQPEIDAALGRIADREARRGDRIVQASAPAAAPGAGKAASAAVEKGAAAVEFGSAEAGSAIARFRNQGGDDKPIKSVDKTTKDHLSEARAQTLTLKEILAKTGQPLSAFTF